MDDDRALAEAASRGDRGAFERLADRYLDRTLRICVRLLGNVDDAEDATQETFARAWSRLNSFAGQSTFGTWVTSIALRLCTDIDRARKSRQKHVTELPALFNVDRDAPTPRRITPLLHAEQRETVARLQDALQRLPPRLRTALTLRTIEGLEYPQVAGAMGTTIRSARLYVWEARQRLAREIDYDPRRSATGDHGTDDHGTEEPR